MVRWASVERLEAEPSGDVIVFQRNPKRPRVWTMFVKPIVPAFNGYRLGVRGGDTASDCGVVDSDDCRKVSFCGVANSDGIQTTESCRFTLQQFAVASS